MFEILAALFGLSYVTGKGFKQQVRSNYYEAREKEYNQAMGYNFDRQRELTFMTSTELSQLVGKQVLHDSTYNKLVINCSSTFNEKYIEWNDAVREIAKREGWKYHYDGDYFTATALKASGDYRRLKRTQPWVINEDKSQQSSTTSKDIIETVFWLDEEKTQNPKATVVARKVISAISFLIMCVAFILACLFVVVLLFSPSHDEGAWLYPLGLIAIGILLGIVPLQITGKIKQKRWRHKMDSKRETQNK